LSYAEILTEQEYAESTDHYIGGANADLGLRRLPCQKDTGEPEASLGGHIMCGRCARKWLRLVSSRRIVRHRRLYHILMRRLIFDYASLAW
jgi:hypothetical protein